MIEGIEHVSGDFEAVFLMELHLFSDAHIEAANAEATHGPAPSGSAVRSQQDGTKILYSRGWIGKVVDPRASIAGAATRSVAGRANAAGAADALVNAAAEGARIHRWDGALGNAKDESTAQRTSR